MHTSYYWWWDNAAVLSFRCLKSFFSPLAMHFISIRGSASRFRCSQIGSYYRNNTGGRCIRNSIYMVRVILCKRHDMTLCFYTFDYCFLHLVTIYYRFVFVCIFSLCGKFFFFIFFIFCYFLASFFGAAIFFFFRCGYIFKPFNK